MSSWNWEIENKDYLEKTITRCRRQKIILPTFEQLKRPESIPDKFKSELKKIEMQDVHPLNLFRINWRNDSESGGIGEINYLEIPKDITGVEARIIGLVNVIREKH